MQQISVIATMQSYNAFATAYIINSTKNTFKMDYGLFNIKQFIMLDSGVANTSLTISATVANHIFGQISQGRCL